MALATAVTPTPALSLRRSRTRRRRRRHDHLQPQSRRSGTASSTRPATAAPAYPSIMSSIESYLGQPNSPTPPTPAPIEEVDFNPPYIAAIARLRRPRCDPRLRLPLPHRLHVRRRPRQSSPASSPARRSPSSRSAARSTPPSPASTPSPSSPTSRPPRKPSSREHCDAGLITDGDADRIGAVDEHGNVVDAHKILALLTLVAARTQGLARRHHPRLQHHQDGRPHRRQVRPQAQRARHRLQVRLPNSCFRKRS